MQQTGAEMSQRMTTKACFHIVGGNPAALMIMRTIVIMVVGDKLRNIP